MVKPEVAEGWLWLRGLLQNACVTATDPKRRVDLKNLLDVLSEIPEAERYAWVREELDNLAVHSDDYLRRHGLTKEEMAIRGALLAAPKRCKGGFLYPYQFDGDPLGREEWIRLAEV